MTHRIAIIVAACAVLVGLATPALAGPSDRQPAQVRLTLGEARYYAHTAAGYIADALARPEKPHVGTCKSMRHGLLWSCPANIDSARTRCTVLVWVWGDKNANRYYEFHNLRCADR